MAFVPLHLHSQYSILDALASIQDIAGAAAAQKLTAIALTDHGNLYGAIEFYKACKAVGVKPIIGCEVYIAPGSRFNKVKVYGQKTAYHLTLLAKNKKGYHNLCKLVSKGFTEGFYYHPRIDKELLEEHKDGLICLSGCMSGSVANAALSGSEEELKKEILFFKNLFQEDFFLEIQRHRMTEMDIKDEGLLLEPGLESAYRDFINKQDKLNSLLINAGDNLDIPLVATNDTHYIRRHDFAAHEILLNVSSGEPCEIWEKDSLGNNKNKVLNPKRRTYPSREIYLKSPEEMRALFHDLPEAIENTSFIAERCNVDIDFTEKHYPVFSPPGGLSTDQYLRKIAQEGILRRYTPERLAKIQGDHPLKIVQDRLNYEMEVLSSKGMCDYLLIVFDFISWAKKQGIPMGPGRGSGAGSIICYLTGITDIEPLRFHLFFERFINPERLSYPDLDIDICMDRRQEVIDYVSNKYGKECVAQIITFGTMKARMAIKDVGRVLSVPLSKVIEIAALIPEDPNMTIDKALEMDIDLVRMIANDGETARIIDLARKLEGSIRNTGTHAAGMIICADPLTDHIPICTAKDTTMPVTQYSMKPVEMVGMLKVDFLGLKTLTSIQKAAENVQRNYGIDIDWPNLSLEDKKTFELLNQGNTLGIFQIESAGMQDLARNLHLDKFEEIIAVLSLYRPGPMDMIPSYIARKHGHEAIEIEHFWMKDILDETYGIIVYQEQVMHIAQKLAGYSLGEGDVLRRAMGKKDAIEMAKQREKFIFGAEKNAIANDMAARIFDKMEKFAAYGFNKSHAASYGFLTYVTAYFKAHYPSEWMAALLTCDRDDISKVAKFLGECQEMNIAILSPDVNESGREFMATQKGIRFAMSGIKGVGEGVVQAIVEERSKKGSFKSLLDLLSRINLKKLSKKSVETLIEAGAFDFTKWSRDALRESLEPMWNYVGKQQKERDQGILTLFDYEEEKKHFLNPPEVQKKYTETEQLLREKELMGFFLTGHPMNSYRNILKDIGAIPFQKFEGAEDEAIIRVAFILESLEVRIAHKTQRKFAITAVSDGSNRLEMMIWSELFESEAANLKENQLYFAVVQVDRKLDGPIRLTARWIVPLSMLNDQTLKASDDAYDKAQLQVVKSKYFKRKSNEEKKEIKPTMFHIEASFNQMSLSRILLLKEIFRSHPGSSKVCLDFHEGDKVIASLYINEPWGVNPSAELKKKILVLEGIKII